MAEFASFVSLVAAESGNAGALGIDPKQAARGGIEGEALGISAACKEACNRALGKDTKQAGRGAGDKERGQVAHTRTRKQKTVPRDFRSLSSASRL
jgi:hypothetical protein